MELLLFRSDDFARLYNCSRMEIEQVPLARRQNVPLGAFFIGLGLVEEVGFHSSFAFITAE